MDEHDNADLCGIDGKPDEVVTISMFNRFARRVMVGHVQPLKVQVAEQGKKIDELSGTINEWLTRLDASFQTMRTLVWVVGLIVSVIVLIANYPSEVITILRAVAKEP